MTTVYDIQIIIIQETEVEFNIIVYIKISERT